MHTQLSTPVAYHRQVILIWCVRFCLLPYSIRISFGLSVQEEHTTVLLMPNQTRDTFEIAN